MYARTIAIAHQSGPEERPPGGARTREVGRSVITLPQFWLDPVANLFALTDLRAPICATEEEDAVALLAAALFSLTGAGAAIAPGLAETAFAAGLRPRAAGLLDAEYPPPNMSDPASELPPGGAWSLVELRPVMKLPQFWLDPVANLLEETLAEDSLAPPPKIKDPAVLRPPAGAWMRVELRSERKLSTFCPLLIILASTSI